MKNAALFKTNRNFLLLFLLVFVSSCHVNRYYADRGLLHEPVPKEETLLSALKDDFQEQMALTDMALNEAPAGAIPIPDDARPAAVKKSKPRTSFSPVSVLQTRKVLAETRKTIRQKKNSLSRSGKPKGNQNMAVFAVLLACALLTGLLALAYLLFSTRSVWMVLAGIALALFVTCMVFLILQPIN